MMRVVALLLLSTGLLAQVPETGLADPALASYDRLMLDLLQRYKIPGGAIAVTRNGKLVLARGYGYADQDRKTPVQPDSLFRLASISKTFTSAAVLKLVEQGKLHLDDKAFAFLNDLRPLKGKTPDPRIASVTLRQILHHTGGWDRDASFDPMFRPIVIAEAFGETPPAGCESVIRYMLGQKLDFDPGARFAYSNFGFCVLGRIIERVSGMRYEEFVKREILAPSGITRMKVGKSLASDDAAGEVHYYAASTARSVFPPLGKTVPWTYGGFNLEAMDSHGGWIASAVDLVKFANAIDGRRGTPLLSKASIRELTSRPAAPMVQDTPAYYGLGWNIRPTGKDANWWHTGSLPGTSTLLVRTHHGYAWAAVFNLRPEGKNQLPVDIDSGMWNAFGEVTAWPDRDLFAHR
jgi:CubicO group peptidase (beta-lactamase class C family)